MTLSFPGCQTFPILSSVVITPIQLYSWKLSFILSFCFSDHHFCSLHPELRIILDVQRAKVCVSHLLHCHHQHLDSGVLPYLQPSLEAALCCAASLESECQCPNVLILL